MHLLTMAEQGCNNVFTREYRKGNWTVNEMLVLIEAKEMYYERRMKSDGRGNKPTELRWKWVEDYCWKRDCSRSQNQCNDKWDNLMRDYKKVREYQSRIAADGKQGGGRSYWEMEKNQRKDNNLPTNMLCQMYERLEQVVEKKIARTVVAGGGSGDGSDPNVPNLRFVMDTPMTSTLQPSLPLLQQHRLLQVPIPAAVPFPPPPPLPSTAAPVSYVQPLPTVDSDTSEYSDSPAKRRRRGGGNGEGTTSDGISDEVSTAISKSASIIGEANHASEEREEIRHRDLQNFHERRLKLEESKTEINKKRMDDLVDAINKLDNSILALASHKSQSSAPK
ncbi:LOW QUALITY PROTEIN: WASH complex subunit 1-like [Hibiscus syriacus]|uniref:LOW QUALITY PROTEIN: WASH complex subunit 1-like n=1 Tax=Hibiscus syriacus TaxID=106335 RepID=UPI001921FD6A|nr:LOW QUALITY PROTEIN: WASH complex subunit 1-like [Hibiscus syriacus]